jgi:hypothetical protein
LHDKIWLLFEKKSGSGKKQLTINSEVEDKNESSTENYSGWE